MQRGHIEKHHGAWTLVYRDVQYRDGRPRRTRVRVKLATVSALYPTKSSVRLLADEKLRPVNERRVTPESSARLFDFIENTYFPAMKTKLRPSTYLNYETSIYRKHLKARLHKSKIRVRDFRTRDAQHLLDDIHATTEISHRTLLHIKNFLSGVFKFAKRHGIVDGINPVTDCEAPGKSAKFKGAAYSIEDFEGMIERLDHSQIAQDVLGLLFFSGLRQSEARALRWKDWNEEGATVHIDRAVWRTRLGETKNPASVGTIPVLPMLANMLRARRERLKAAGKPPGANDYIFAGEKRGAPLDFHNLENRVIRPALSDGAISYRGLHGFRRGLASNLFGLGVNPKVIGAILRHENLATTLEFYTQVRDDESRAAMAKLQSQMEERNARQSGLRLGDKTL